MLRWVGERAGPNSNDEILIVSQFYWPEPSGSAPVVSDIAQWLAEKGHPVTVLTSRPFYPTDRVYPEYTDGSKDRECVKGVRVVRVPTRVPKGAGIAARLMNELYFYVHATNCLRDGNVVPSRRVVSLCPSILAVCAAQKFVRHGGRHTSLVHDIQSGLAGALFGRAGRAVRWMLSRIERRALNRTNGLIVMSRDIIEELERIGVHQSMSILPPHVDLDEIFPLPRSGQGRPQVLYSGNLGRKQGLEQLLLAASRLEEMDGEIDVVIRGTGNQEEALRRQASDLSLSNVTFESFVKRSQLNTALGEAAVHVLCQEPSGAGFAVPSKVFTAMASGRPIICSVPDSGNWRLLSESSQALTIVSPDDPRAFAEAIHGMVHRPAYAAAVGRRGRAFVESVAGRDTVMRQVQSIVCEGDQ